MPRLGRVVFDVAAQAHDEIIDGARIGIFMQAPDFLEHGLARDRFAFVLDQIPQYIHFHQSQGKDLIAHAQLEEIEMDRFVAESENVIAGLVPARIVRVAGAAIRVGAAGPECARSG